MRIPQLRMTSQLATISIKQEEGKQYIQQPQAILQIRQGEADLQIHTTPPRLNIDQSRAWEEMDLMPISKRIALQGQKGFHDALDGTARRAREGREMMEIEKGGSPIIDQAARRAHPPMKQLGMSFIPTPLSVKTMYHPGKVEIDATRKDPNMEVNIQKPRHHYERGGVAIGMKQHADLQIDVVDLYV